MIYALMRRQVRKLFALTLPAGFVAGTVAASAVTISYQGLLQTSTGPATGWFDLRFTLFDAATGGAQVAPAFATNAVVANSGRFNANLEFGSDAFPGTPRWLEIEVRTNGGGAFVLLAPRQPITAAPYAVRAESLTGTLPADQLAGNYAGAVSLLNTSNRFAGSFAGNGGQLTNLTASTISGSLAVANLPALADGVTNDLSSVLQGGLQQLLQFLYLSNGPINFVSFGDSISASYRSIQKFIAEALMARFGTAGYSLDSFGNATLAWATNGALRLNPPTPNWFAVHYSLPPGGTLWWYKETDARGVLATEVGVFWIARPEGGAFTLSSSTEGGAWTPRLTLDGYAPTPTGMFTNVPVGFGWHRVRVDGGSGTNLILGPYLRETPSTGVHVTWFECGGITMMDFTNVPPAIRDPVFAVLQPKLLLWHMKENVSDSVRAALGEFESMLQRTAPSCDVVYIGSPFAIYDTYSNSTRNNNRMVRDFAISKGRIYVDCMTPCISYEWLSGNGLMDDAAHPNNRCNEWLASLVWEQLKLDLVDHFSRNRPAGPLAINARSSGDYAFSVTSVLSGADGRAFFGLRNSFNVMGVFFENSTNITRAALLGGSGVPTELNSPTPSAGPVFSQGRVRRGAFESNGVLDLKVGLQSRNVWLTNDAIGAAAVWLYTNDVPTFNVPNGSLCTTTDGRLFIRSNGVWVAK